MYKSRKMFLVKIATLATLVLLFVLLKFSSVAQADTPVGGTISQNTTWTLANSPYVVNSRVVVNSGVTLTIEPGVVVKFQPLLGLGLTVNGTLIAQGTSTNKIVFTSNATTPAPGDWGGIGFNPTSAGTPSKIDFAIIRYGGGSYYDMVGVFDASPPISNSLIENGNQNGIYASGTSGLAITGNTIQNNLGSGIALNPTASATISGNTITGNKYGISATGSSQATITSNNISNNLSWAVVMQDDSMVNLSSNTVTGNSYNAIYLTGARSVNATLPKQELVYVAEWFDIGQAATVTIAPGTILKSAEVSLNQLNVYGTLIAQGTPADPIIFTSLRDDAHGGDTNGDGGATVPAPGDWAGINIWAGSSNFKYASFIYGAPSNFYPYSSAALMIRGGSPTISNSSFTNNYGAGIYVYGTGTAPTISQSVFTGNGYGISFSNWSGGTVRENTISGNRNDGIFLLYGNPVITGNTITNNVNGIDNLSDPGQPVPIVLYNSFSGNRDYDVSSWYRSDQITAIGNTWGNHPYQVGDIISASEVKPAAYSYDSEPVPNTNPPLWRVKRIHVAWGSFPLGPDSGKVFGSETSSGFFGEPVNTATGNYTATHEDISIPGKGLAISFTRTYNSQDNGHKGYLGYSWTHSYEQALYFHGDGSITVLLADGKRQKFTRNADGTYSPPPGVFEKLTRNADGTYTYLRKNQSKLNFDSKGALSSLVDRFGNTTTLTYTNNLLTSVTDPAGRSITLTYSNGRIIKVQDNAGRFVEYSYDVNGNLSTVKDLNGKTTTYGYDSNHQLTTVNEPEPSTNPFLTNHYDTSGRVDWQKDAFLNTTTYTYDTVNRKTTITDNRGKVTVHGFDDSYRLTKSTDPLLYSVTSVWSLLDVPDSITNQNNKVTNFGYDANGNITLIEDPLLHKVTANYDLSNNNVLWTKDALTHQTSYNYDVSGKFLQSLVSPIGTTSFDYYSDGFLKSLTDANSHVTTFGYNAYGNVTSITDALAKTTNFEYDTVGRMTSSTDANLHKTQFVYDNEANILTIKDPLAISDPLNRHQVDFTYDGNGNQKSFKDANNNLTQFNYDGMDNLTSVIDANNKTTSYAYDVNYNLARVTDPLLHTTTYTYYDNNRLWKITDPLLKVLQFSYDPAGNLTKTIYPNRNETYYSYYDDNLLKTVTFKNEPTSYTYAYNPTHTISNVTDNAGKVFSFTYDNGNRLTGATDQTNPAITGGFTVQRGWDGVSNLTSLTYAGTTYTYTYNARDDLTSLLLPTGTVSFAYDNARNRTDVTTPDTSNRHSTYNDANRITQVKNTTASGIQTFDYTHDSNGNIKTENSVTYNYDALNRLTHWVHSGVTTSYTYDDAGNLLQVADNGVPVKTLTYNAANQITTKGFTYDNNGNMTSDGTYTYVYDGENRLKQVKQGAKTIASYAYDFMGRRSSVTEGGATTYFHYDGWNVVAETASGGNVVATYTYDNRNQPVSMTRGGQTYYYQFNAHGDVMSLTSSSGQVANTYTYDPWGKVLTSSEAVPNPYRYAGYRYDSSTSLYYLQHRYYSPGIGRFITKDRFPGNLRDPQSLNRYIYSENDPVNQTDPSGLSSSPAKNVSRSRILPDYISANLNVAIPIPKTYNLLGVSGQIVVDRYGNVYLAPGVNIGKTFGPIPVSGSVVAGWIPSNTKPSETDLKNLLTGNSLNPSIGGLAGATGISGTWTPGVGTGIEGGAVSPQAGISWHYSWEAPFDVPVSW